MYSHQFYRRAEVRLASEHSQLSRTRCATQLSPPVGGRQYANTLAAPDPAQRCELATTLRCVADNLAKVSDGKTTSHVPGVLAHLLTPTDLSRNRSIPRQR